MRTIWLSLSLVAAMAIPAALAQETHKSAAAKLDREFAASDANKNGTLELREVEARMKHMKAGANQLNDVQAKRLAALWFRRADANKDGKVTKAESQALMAGVFARYDLDHDGRIDGREAAAARAGAKAGPPAGAR